MEGRGSSPPANGSKENEDQPYSVSEGAAEPSCTNSQNQSEQVEYTIWLIILNFRAFVGQLSSMKMIPQIYSSPHAT